MDCPLCNGPTRRFGRNRSGSQRYRCDACARTFTDGGTLVVDRRRVDAERLSLCLRMLLEGNSIRAVGRLLGMGKKTIIREMVEAGERCERFLHETISGVAVGDIQADELWGFIFCKEKTRLRNGYSEECGDAYCYTAIERSSKLLVTWHLGKRSMTDTYEFARKLRRATVGAFQLTTDGFHPYRAAIPAVFGRTLDFAVLVKNYHADPEDDSRYSPPEVVRTTIRMQTGTPDEEQICTSHVERHNRTLRMQVRRLTRLTDAHSKKWANHEAALALFFAYYNYCRVHMTLKTTPAVAAGLASEPWTVEKLLDTASRF